MVGATNGEPGNEVVLALSKIFKEKAPETLYQTKAQNFYDTKFRVYSNHT